MCFCELTCKERTFLRWCLLCHYIDKVFTTLLYSIFFRGRPLPQEDMKNIIFNVFGEDMSTGVVTQVKFLKFVRKPVTAEVLEKVMMKVLKYS